jgi:hypothetical protein
VGNGIVVLSLLNGSMITGDEIKSLKDALKWRVV